MFASLLLVSVDCGIDKERWGGDGKRIQRVHATFVGLRLVYENILFYLFYFSIYSSVVGLQRLLPHPFEIVVFGGCIDG